MCGHGSVPSTDGENEAGLSLNIQVAQCGSREWFGGSS